MVRDFDIDNIICRPVPNMYETLCGEIKNDNILKEDFIDTLSILRENENLYPTYYKTDFHWNGFGATVSYTPVVNLLAKRSGFKKDIFHSEDYRIYYRPGFKGGQLNNVPLLESWHENALFTEKIGNITMKLVNGEYKNSAKHWINIDREVPLGTVLFIGDSYTEYMLLSDSGVLDCFKEAYWVHWDSSEGVFNNYLEKVDYIILEGIESSMRDLAERISKFGSGGFQ